MDLRSWLKGEKGRGSALAAHLGVTRARVSQMGTGNTPVPQKFFRPIRDYTGGSVTLEELLPPLPASDHDNLLSSSSEAISR